MRRRQLVLVVDDDPAICRLLELRLCSNQVEVHSALSAAEAGQFINEHGRTIDLILLDVGLPDADGFTLCRTLRKQAEMAEVPIIFLTGRDSPEDTIRGFEAGGTDYVIKPFHQAVLHARVRAALRAQRLLYERSDAVATLRASEQRYRCLSEHCFDMISRHDREGRYLDVSPSCQQLSGYRPEELVGRCAYDSIHPDDLSIVRENHRSLMRGEPARPVIFRGRRKDGGYIWLESMCRMLPESAEFNCVTRDITSRKKAEEAIRANEAKLQTITAQLPAIVWTTDQRLVVESMNGSLLLEFELEGAAMIGRSLQEVISHIVKRDGRSILDAHRSAMRGDSVSARFSRDERDFELRIEPLLGSEGECIGCLGIAFDVTERRRVEEAERAQASLEVSVTAMEQVLGVIGHELRTPLTGLRVMSEFLLSDVDASDERSQFLNMIHDEAIRMASMVNNLLEAARINSGKARWNWSTFDLSEVCRQALDIVRHANPNHDVTIGGEVISSEGRAGQPLMMNGDRDAIHGLLVNLVTNAQKHTHEGVITVKVTESNREGGRWIDIEVRDTGEGMSRQTLNKLGVPFALNAGVVGDGASRGPSNGHGSGLGIAICKGIALAHGGTISFDSQPGMGTTVHVAVRADLDAPSQAKQRAIFVNEVGS